MGNGVEQRLAQFLRFRQQPRLFGLSAETETVQHQGGLPGKGVEQIALFERRRLLVRQFHGDDTSRAAIGGHRHINGLGRRQVGGEAGHALFLFGNGKHAGGMGRRRKGAIGVAQENGHLALKSLGHLAHQPSRHVIHVGGVGQVAGQQVQGGGTFLAAALGPFLPAKAGNQLSHHDGHDKVHDEHHHVGELRHLQGVEGLRKEEIPQQGAGAGGQQRGAASDKAGLHHHAEQKDQGQGLRVHMKRRLQKCVESGAASHRGHGG